MSANAAAPPSAAALHLPTVLAIALVAYALTNVAHEGLGHGGMCVALGGEPRVLNAVYFDCGEEGLAGRQPVDLRRRDAGESRVRRAHRCSCFLRAPGAPCAPPPDATSSGSS